MKIGIISREYPPLTHVGGIATFSAACASLLTLHGHEVHVVCNGLETKRETLSGITVHRVKMIEHHFKKGKWFFPIRKWYRKHLPHYLEALTWARTVERYLTTHLDPGEFDLFEYPETGGEGAFFPKRILSSSGRSIHHHPKLVARIHTGWMDSLANNKLEKFLILRLQRISCNRADRLVSPSRYMADTYLSQTLRVKKKVTVNHNPITFWEKPIDWENKKLVHLLFVGRIEHRKGLQVLLNALTEMGQDANSIKLRVVGHLHHPTGQLDRDCQVNFEKTLKIKSANPDHGFALEYAGPGDHSDMPKHYDWAGILVLPSLMENYPYVALEGLSRGCYLVGSQIGGIPEIIDRASRGILFESENSTQLAGKIRECICRDREISENARDIVEQIRSEFSPEACYIRLMEVYGADFTKEGQE